MQKKKDIILIFENMGMFIALLVIVALFQILTGGSCYCR